MSDHDHESIQSDYTTSHFSVRELYTNDDYSSTCSSVGTDKQIKRQRSRSRRNVTLCDLPKIIDISLEKRHIIYRKKLQLCSEIYDFSQPNTFIKQKEAKRVALMELVEYAKEAPQLAFSEVLLSDFFFTVTSNILIPLKSDPIENYIKEDIEITIVSELNPSWSHLQIVYELLLRFLLSECVDMRMTKKYFTHSFIISLISIFDSKDQREREYLKTILHRIYLKYMPLRTFIRQNINYTLLTYMYETFSFSGISELLEIYGSIISGYSIPLKYEHLQFLHRVLLPLHSAGDECVYYHTQLCYCTYQYIEKDSSVAVKIVKGLIKKWPYTTAAKQLLFINEIEEILSLVTPIDFSDIAYILFKHFGYLIKRFQYQIVERILMLWDNEYIVSMIGQNRYCILPSIYNPLIMVIQKNWMFSLRSMAQNVLDLFLEMDPKLYDNIATTDYHSQNNLLEIENDIKIKEEED